MLLYIYKNKKNFLLEFAHFEEFIVTKTDRRMDKYVYIYIFQSFMIVSYFFLMSCICILCGM